MTSLVQAWQQALAAEQQASFGYGLLGPRLSSPAAVALAQTCQSAHDGLSRSTAAAIAAAGAQPAPPAADYPDLYPVATAAAAQALAIRLELAGASAWRYLYAVAAAPGTAQEPSVRGFAQAQLTASAVRATQWAVLAGSPHPTIPFPGI